MPALPTGRFSGLALGPNNAVAAAYWGVNLATDFYGIDVLHFVDGQLQVQNRATITGLDPKRMAMVSLTSSVVDLRRMYAAAAGAGDGGDGLLGVLRSNDGGQNWQICGTTLATPIPDQGDLVNAAGNQGNGWNNCIAASPVDPDTVVLGWRHTGVFLSTDGGATWQLKHGDDSPHLHSDTHAVRFDPADLRGRVFYVCSDGGVAGTGDLGDTYDSSANIALPDLQFQSMQRRQSDGMFTASPITPGVVAGCLQDNGVVWANVSDAKPWNLLIGGDGFRGILLQTGELVWTSNGAPAPRICSCDGHATGPVTTVPIVDPKPGLRADPNGLYDVVGPIDGHWYRNTILSAVPSPSFRNAAGQLMYALGSVYGDAYGLFADADGSNAKWSYLASVPIDISRYEIRSLSSLHGDNVFAGTSDGRIYAIDTKQGSVLETTVTTRTDDEDAVTRITTYDSNLNAYAIHGSNLLRLGGLGWTKVDGLPDETFFSVLVHHEGRSNTVFVATDARVFSSRDGGATWSNASLGLPERPHCGDLAIGPDFAGPGSRMYLSTYGRSVWSTAIGKPLQQIDVFWVGPDGGIGSTWADPGLNDGRWATPFPIAPPAAARPDSGIAAVTRLNGQLDVFWIGPDGGIGSTWADPGLNDGGWATPFPIAPPAAARPDSGIAAVTR